MASFKVLSWQDMGKPEGIPALRGSDPVAESPFFIGCLGLLGFTFALLRSDRRI
jgi:hypothetical protein